MVLPSFLSYTVDIDDNACKRCLLINLVLYQSHEFSFQKDPNITFKLVIHRSKKNFYPAMYPQAWYEKKVLFVKDLMKTGI